MVTFLLLVVGGLNWLLVGLFGWDIGMLLGGMDSMAAKVVYILVGLAAIYEIATHKATCKMCDGRGGAASGAPAGGGSPGGPGTPGMSS